MILYFWRYIIPDALHYNENPPYYQCEKVIDNATSVIWCERYQEPGEVSVMLRASSEMLSFLWELGMIITRTDSDRAMRVDKVEMVTTSDGKDYIRLSGKSAEGFLSDRIIMQRGSMYMKPDEAILYYTKENLGAYWYYHEDADHPHGSSLDRLRYFNLYAEGNSSAGDTSYSMMDPFGYNLGSFATEMCKSGEFGFKAVFDGEKLVYSCYKGEDRTLNQSERDAVVFADDFRNIGASEFSRSRSGYCSHVVVGGSGTGSERVFSDAYKNYRSPIGIGGNLREKFIDQPSVSPDSLRGIASDAVLSAAETCDLAAEAESGGSYKYREHYFLGDRVSVVNRYGISGTATVAEVVETEDENGVFCIPKLTGFDTSEYIVPERPVKPDPPPPPPPEWDKFEAEHTDAVVIVRLDADGNETSDIYYATATPPGASPQLTAWGRAVRRLYEQYEIDSSARFNVYYGNGVPYSEEIWRDYLVQYIDPNYGENHNNISMIRLPKVSGGELFAFQDSIGSTKGFTRLKKVIMPESTDPDGYIIPQHFLTRSAVEEIVFRTDRIKCIRAAAFFRCESLREIELPTVVGYRSDPYSPTEYIQGYAFNGCYDITITLNNPENSIEGAPWRATNATVIWKG